MRRKYWLESLKGRDHSEDQGVDVRILRRILGKPGWWCGLDLSGSGEEPVAGSCKHGNEPSVCIQGGKFLG
jgi:hypothetical protein